MEATSHTNTESIWEVAEACGLCSSTRNRELFSIHQKRYVSCAECQVARLYDRVAADKLDLIYSDFYASSGIVLSKQQLEVQLANPTFSFRRRRLEAFVPVQQRKIFEIGCGDGNFLGYLQNNDWKVQGSEFGQKTLELIKARHGIEVAVGDFTTLPIEPGSIEVIGAYHVFEHLYEPLEWIRAVRRALKPDGFLHLQLPNFRCLERYLTKDCWNFLSFPQHVYFYSPATLERLLENVGFRPVSTTTYDPWHSPGTTLASARNYARRLLTGRLPWSNTLDKPSSIDDSKAKVVTAAINQKKWTTRLFDTSGKPVAMALARIESLFGFGNVIDVIARAAHRANVDETSVNVRVD